MTGSVRSAGGEQWTLPVLTGWEICRTDGDPCGAFTVRFAANEKTVEILRQADTFLATEDGKTVFTGVVDEFQITLGSGGLEAELSGRDMAARLLDNQCRAAELLSAQLEDVLARYVRPRGVTKIQTEALPAVPNLSIQTGDSCWQVLCGYCRHAADVRPRFDADGTLVLQRSPAGKRIVVTMANAPTEVTLQEKRYGVISEQTVLNYSRKSIETTKNPDFSEGCCRVAVQSGKKLKATWRTGAQRIADSMDEAVTLQVTLPGGFLAEPCDRAEVNLAPLGVAGSYRVTEALTRLDGRGLRTRLTLRLISRA